jgi:hypothetical protein
MTEIVKTPVFCRFLSCENAYRWLLNKKHIRN